ncbi:MAG: transposase [Acidobacteria bacterium]|nr:transposase [Acidobacteriota bacterium]
MRKSYDLAFKKEVIRKYLTRQTMASTSREMGVNENVLYRWKRKMVATADGETDAKKLAMRKRIMDLDIECEILKKAALIFGPETAAVDHERSWAVDPRR